MKVLITTESIRGFAAGLLVAATLLGIVYFFAPGKAMTIDEMKSLLTSKSYVIHTQEEWNKLSSGQTNNNANAAPNPAPKDTTKQKITVTVSTGMTSYDVGKALQQAKIVDSPLAFSQEIDKRGLSNKLRPGTYEIDPSMTLDQIIAMIFK